jgi:holo-[acyl-carrier protein] synthase
MKILGHGIDLVETSRIEEILRRHGERFLDRVFTIGEQEHSLGSRRRHEHLAGRFAAKEACLKALGTGLTHGIGWTEVEVAVLASGRPVLRLTGRAAEVAASVGIR